MGVVKIKEATPGKEYNGKTLIKVTLEDGKTGSSYDQELLSLVGKEVDLDIKDAKEFNGIKQYYFNIPKAKGAFPKKDYTVDKRIASLNAASRFPGLKSDQVLELANKYLTWLNG